MSWVKMLADRIDHELQVGQTAKWRSLRDSNCQRRNPGWPEMGRDQTNCIQLDGPELSGQRQNGTLKIREPHVIAVTDKAF
jgi:hypothetical protein